MTLIEAMTYISRWMSNRFQLTTKIFFRLHTSLCIFSQETYTKNKNNFWVLSLGRHFVDCWVFANLEIPKIEKHIQWRFSEIVARIDLCICINFRSVFSHSVKHWGKLKKTQNTVYFHFLLPLASQLSKDKEKIA